MSQRRITAYILMTIASLIWGLGGPLIKRSLEDIPPMIFLTYRFVIVAVFSIIYIAKQRPKLPKKPKETLMAFFAGLLTVPVGLSFSFMAFERAPALTVTTILSLSPIVMIFLGAAVLHDRISKIERLGIAITAFGSLLIIMTPVIDGSGALDFSSLWGNVFAISAVFIGSFSMLIDKLLLRKRIDPFALSQIGFLIGLVTIGPLTLYLYDTSTILTILMTASPISHFGVWYMAILGSLLAYGFTEKALQSINMSQTAIFRYLTPIWAAPVAILWLGESVSPLFLFAAAIVITGILVAEYRRPKKHAHHKHPF